MLTGLDEFSQKCLQFCVPLNKIGKIALQVLLFKKEREKNYSEYISTLVLFILRKIVGRFFSEILMLLIQFYVFINLSQIFKSCISKTLLEIFKFCFY